MKLPWCAHTPCHDALIPRAMMRSYPVPWCAHTPCHDALIPRAMMRSYPVPWCAHTPCHEALIPRTMMRSYPVPWCAHTPYHTRNQASEWEFGTACYSSNINIYSIWITSLNMNFFRLSGNMRCLDIIHRTPSNSCWSDTFNVFNLLNIGSLWLL